MFIRYPGSKAKLDSRLFRHFPLDIWNGLFRQPLPVYCEPFFGSGAISWKLLPRITSPQTRVTINDMDPGISSLWRAVRDVPKELIALVDRFQPSPEAFYLFKQEDGIASLDPVVAAFRKLALHQMSYSGLGFMSGGPLGGREQKSEYNTSCRWNAVRITSGVLACHKMMRRFQQFEINCGDFASPLGTLPDKAFVYLDPPYYLQGEVLYRYSMSPEDHARLASVLRPARYRWVLSYDDHPKVRDLYAWASIASFEMTPTVQKSSIKRRKNREIVITNFL